MNAINSFRLCKLSNHDLIIKIDKQTDRMFQIQRLPTRNIPAEPNEDYDLLIGELILRFGELESFLNSLEDDLTPSPEDVDLEKHLRNTKRKISMFLSAEYGKSGDPLLGTVVSFPDNNEMVFFQDFNWWKGIPANVEFKIESAIKSNDEFWLVADGYGNLSKPNCYGNGKILVKRKYILEALSKNTPDIAGHA